MRIFAVFCLMVSLILVGCGGNDASPTTPTSRVQVNLATPSVNLSPSGTFTFSASVTGTSNTAVTWSVTGGTSSGSITSGGVYTAPASPGQYRVVATSAADPGVTATATITVQSGVNITLSPQNPTIKLGDDVTFTAAVTGTSNPNAVITVQGTGSGGTITGAGVYTAPDTPGTYTILAKAAADLTKTTTTTVVVIPGTEVRITSPTRQLIAIAGSTIDFKGKVVGNVNKNFTWSVVESGGGTITSNGVWTAPSTAGTYTIKATSTADSTKTATQTVKVVAAAKLVLSIEGRGDVEVDLNSVAAPLTCANIVSLANKGFYDGIKIHRVESSLIQGGDPLTKTLPLSDSQIGTGGPGYTINFENTGISHVRGVISMARRDGDFNSAGSQFFIMKSDNTTYDGQYASFGNVSVGLSIVDAIGAGDVITSAVITE